MTIDTQIYAKHSLLHDCSGSVTSLGFSQMCAGTPRHIHNPIWGISGHLNTWKPEIHQTVRSIWPRGLFHTCCHEKCWKYPTLNISIMMLEYKKCSPQVSSGPWLLCLTPLQISSSRFQDKSIDSYITCRKPLQVVDTCLTFHITHSTYHFLLESWKSRMEGNKKDDLIAESFRSESQTRRHHER